MNRTATAAGPTVIVIAHLRGTNSNQSYGILRLLAWPIGVDDHISGTYRSQYIPGTISGPDWFITHRRFHVRFARIDHTEGPRVCAVDQDGAARAVSFSDTGAP